MLSGPNETKLDLSALKRWHGVTVDQRDFSLGMIDHSIDPARGHKVTRVHDELLHQSSIQNDDTRYQPKASDGVLSKALAS
jgi:hypothetical protein